MCLLAETEAIQAILREEGILVETLAEAHPMRIQPARILSYIYARLGEPKGGLERPLPSPLYRVLLVVVGVVGGFGVLHV